MIRACVSGCERLLCLRVSNKEGLHRVYSAKQKQYIYTSCALQGKNLLHLSRQNSVTF